MLLSSIDTDRIIAAIPPSVRDMLRQHPRTRLAGGFLRDIYFDKPPHDLDLFGPARDCPLRDLPVLIQNNTAIWQPPDSNYPVQWVRKAVSPWYTQDFDFTINQFSCGLYQGELVVNYAGEIEDIFPSFTSSLRLTNHSANDTDPQSQDNLLARYFHLKSKGYGHPGWLLLPSLIARLFIHVENIYPDTIEIAVRAALTQKHMSKPTAKVDRFDPLTLTIFNESSNYQETLNNESDRPSVAFNQSSSPDIGVTTFRVYPTLGSTRIEWPAATNLLYGSLDSLPTVQPIEEPDTNP